MIAGLISFLTLIISIAAGIVMLYALIGSRIYDVVLHRSAYWLPKRLHTKLPSITIIVPIRNAEVEIVGFLSKLVAAMDRRSTILVIDAASTDHTVRKVKNFTKQYRNCSVHLRAFRNETNFLKAETMVEKKLITGDVVVRISLDELIDKDTLRSITRYFAAHKNLDVVVPRYTTFFEHTLISAICIYLSYVKQTFLKAHDGFHLTSTPARAQIMTNQYYQNLKQRYWNTSLVPGVVCYQDDIIITRHAPRSIYGFIAEFLGSSYQELQSLIFRIQIKPAENFTVHDFMEMTFASLKLSFRFIFCFMPLPLGYFVYVALALHAPVYLTMCALGVIICLGFVLSEDIKLSFIEKFGLILTIPAALIAFYLLSWMNLVVWIRQGISSFASE